MTRSHPLVFGSAVLGPGDVGNETDHATTMQYGIPGAKQAAAVLQSTVRPSPPLRDGEAFTTRDGGATGASDGESVRSYWPNRHSHQVRIRLRAAETLRLHLKLIFLTRRAGVSPRRRKETRGP